MSLPNFETPRLVTGMRLWNLLLQFGTEYSPDNNPVVARRGFVRLHTDMPAFKKVHAEGVPGAWDAIANLIIPAGAKVFADHRDLTSLWSDHGSRKMRASRVRVHSIYTCQLKPQPAKKACAGYDRDFKYRPGRGARPQWGFSERYEQCAGGIHFFINLRDALNYY